MLTLPKLPRLTDFIEVPGGGGGTPPPIGPTLTVPPIYSGGAPVPPVVIQAGDEAGSMAGAAGGVLAEWFGPSLLRLALFLLGLICVIGAIYLYGTGQDTPEKVLRGAARGAVKAGKRGTAAALAAI